MRGQVSLDPCNSLAISLTVQINCTTLDKSFSPLTGLRFPVRLLMGIEKTRSYKILPWLLAVALSGLFMFFLWGDLARQEQKWQQQLSLQQSTSQASLLASQADLTQQAVLLAQLINEDKAVVELIREAHSVLENEGVSGGQLSSMRLRSQLDVLLQPYWRKMEAAGVAQFNIYLGASATLFLSAQKVDRFGDSVAGDRPVVANAIKQGITTAGMEVGRFGSGYRAVVPVFALDRPEGRSAIAAIEVGMALLTKAAIQNSRVDQGQAVLLHPSLVNKVLWDDMRLKIRANASTATGQWGLEIFTHSIAKEWVSKGLLPSPIGEQKTPWIMRDQGKDYLLCPNNPKEYSDQQVPLAPSKIMVLTWSDVTSIVAAKSAERQLVIQNYVLELILAELALLALVYSYRRRLSNMADTYQQQLQQTRKAGEHSEQRLNLALVSKESGFWEWNVATNRARLSKEWRELSGLPANDGGDIDTEDWLNRIHPSDKNPSYEEMIRHIKGETPMLESEYRLRIADGSYKWILTRGKVVEWQPDGRALLVLGIYTDITDRKNNEIIVLRQQAALQALNEIASVSAVDAKDQLQKALAIGSRYLGLPIATVSAIKGHQYIIKVQVKPDNNNAEGTVNPLSNYLCEYAYRFKDIFACDDLGVSAYSTHNSYQKDKIKSYIGAPIWLNGELYGTLNFMSQHIRHQPYDELDKNFMRLFARWVGVTLERWQHQTEQQALLDRFTKLSENLPGFVFQFQWHPDGRSLFPYASAGISAIYSVNPDEIKETAVKVFRRIHEGDMGWMSEAMSTSATKLTPWSATFRVAHLSRGEIWVHLTAHPERLSDGSTLWHGFQSDVTAAKRSELNLQETNALREAIFDAANIAIISTDQHGLIKTFNRGAETMLGWDAQQMINLNTPARLHLPAEIAKAAEVLSREFGSVITPGFDVLIARAREGDEDENEWTYVRKDGSTLPVSLSVTALRNSAGDIIGYLELGRDISELKRIDQMKTEFISTVSHELRTPLTSISSGLGIIKSGAAGELPDTAAKMLNIAHKNSLRLIHLVNDLMDMDKLMAGKADFDMQPQLLLPIVQHAIETYGGYAEQYNVSYELNSQWAEDIKITVDAQRLLQVLANLLSNAAKFSPFNEVVKVKIEKNFGLARVTVIDKGPGVGEEYRNKIFQKFHRVEGSDARQSGGSGLGLAIAKEMIERMGGKIGFESFAGQGAQFYFELPCEEMQPRYIEKQNDRLPTGKRILVVEDDYDVAELIAMMLRTNNYRVDIAYSGQTALERLALYAYQAITIDLHLPDVSGIKLIRQLRSDSSTQRIPIVVISSHFDELRKEIKNDSIYSNIQWLEKPIDSANIVAAIIIALASSTQVPS